MKNNNELVWRSGGGSTTKIGYVNSNNQRCSGTLGIQGTDHLQFSYKLECLRCGYVYGANGSDIAGRKCPECQNGSAGICFWREGMERKTMVKQLTFFIEREGDGYVSLCPELDIASQGDTIEEARENLREALDLFFETASPKEIQDRMHEVYVTREEVVVG